MKLSTRSRYGIRLMIDIAQHGQEAPVSVKDIARRQDISVKYLEKLSRRLKRAGLIRSKLGSKGGYMLAIAPEKLSLGDLVEVLEGRVDLVDCWIKGLPCPRRPTCIASQLWTQMNEFLTDKLRSISLKDLIENEEFCLPNRSRTAPARTATASRKEKSAGK